MNYKVYLIENNRLFCVCNNETFEFKNNEWIKANNNEITDRLMGYDSSEPRDSPYAIGNTDILSTIKELTQEQVIERYGIIAIDKLKALQISNKNLQVELDKLAEEGNKYFNNNEYDKALEIWKKALELIPESKNSFSGEVWFLSPIGDIYFIQGSYGKSFKCFEDAKNNLSGEEINNPFILLRLGQSAFELGKKN